MRIGFTHSIEPVVVGVGRFDGPEERAKGAPISSPFGTLTPELARYSCSTTRVTTRIDAAQGPRFACPVSSTLYYPASSHARSPRVVLFAEFHARHGAEPSSTGGDSLARPSIEYPWRES